MYEQFFTITRRNEEIIHNFFEKIESPLSLVFIITRESSGKKNQYHPRERGIPNETLVSQLKLVWWNS